MSINDHCPNYCSKVGRKNTAGFQFQTQMNSVIPSPIINNTETREFIPHTVVTEISIPTSSTLVSDLNIPLQVFTKTFRSNSDA